MATRVNTTPSFTFSEPSLVAEAKALVRQFDASADGSRILIWEKTGPDSPLTIHIAHNWFEEFRNRARK